MTTKSSALGKWIAEVHADVGPGNVHIIERCEHDHHDAQGAAVCAWRLVVRYEADNRPAAIWFPRDAEVRRGMV